MTLPFRCAEAALNCWMNWPGFTPCWPRAGPIGGAGVAVPPGAWSLNWTVISFFAMTFVRNSLPRFGGRGLYNGHFDLASPATCCAAENVRCVRRRPGRHRLRLGLTPDRDRPKHAVQRH